MINRRQFLKLIGAGAISGAALASYAFAIEPLWRLKTVTHSIRPRTWPRGQQLRIVALADFHACEPWMTRQRIASVCEKANALKPDITLLLGDFVSSMNFVTGTVAHDIWASELSKLAAPLGVHAIQGNHDWWEDEEAQRSGGGATMACKALKNVNIPVFENDAIRIEHNGAPFWLAGLSSQWALKPGSRFGRTHMIGLEDLDGTLAKITDDAPVILMAHEPDIFPRIPKEVALTLSGHTHGGQVRLFGYSPVVPSKFGDRYAYGHVVEEERDMIVSGGLGCSILPVRFGAPPEITVVELG
ncbi:MAG: metallophosphoesterase [Rhizobiaceae bacterium]